MADVVPFVVMSVEDPRLASFSLDAPEHCWVLCEVDPTGKVARVVNWDGGEPEDQLLVRDWSWVPDALNQERAARDIECDTLRTTLARLTADLAAVTSDRDMWRSECESISAELDLPPGIRPAEGELRRMLGHNRALLAQVTTLTAEVGSLRGELATVRDELAKCADAVSGYFNDGDSVSDTVQVVADALGHAKAAEHGLTAERDEARGLLGECVNADSGDMHTLGADLHRRIAAHLGRSE